MASLDPNTIASLLGVPTGEIAAQVTAKVAESIAKLENATARLLEMPEILYDLKGTTAGQAQNHVNAGTTVIRINLDALLNPEYRDFMLNQMIPHEVAHVAEFQWYGAAGHGYNWQRLMVILGLPAHRTHDLPLKKQRIHERPHKYKCNNQYCGREFNLTNYRHRKLQKRPNYYVCSTCNGRLEHVGS